MHLMDKLADQFETLFGNKPCLLHSLDPTTHNAKGVVIILNKRLIKTEGLTMNTLIPGRAISILLPWYNNQHIDIMVIYALNHPTKIREFWTTIMAKTNANPSLKPNIVLGDFNLVKDSID